MHMIMKLALIATSLGFISTGFTVEPTTTSTTPSMSTTQTSLSQPTTSTSDQVLIGGSVDAAQSTSSQGSMKHDHTANDDEDMD